LAELDKFQLKHWALSLIDARPLKEGDGKVHVWLSRLRQTQPAAVKSLFSHRVAFVDRFLLFSYEILSFQ